MAPILFGGWAAAGPATPRTGASGTTNSRESGTETMGIFLRQAICDRDGRARQQQRQADEDANEAILHSQPPVSRVSQRAVTPASMTSVWPVTQRDSSLAR